MKICGYKPCRKILMRKEGERLSNFKKRGYCCLKHSILAQSDLSIPDSTIKDIKFNQELELFFNGRAVSRFFKKQYCEYCNQLNMPIIFKKTKFKNKMIETARAYETRKYCEEHKTDRRWANRKLSTSIEIYLSKTEEQYYRFVGLI